MKSMPRRSFQLAAAIVLILAALTPLMECFDHWDKSPGPANDTEIHLAAWFAGAGLVLTMAKLLRYAPALVKKRAIQSDPGVSRLLRSVDASLLQPTESPPLVPLRI
jgi:hypothetical protein